MAQIKKGEDKTVVINVLSGGVAYNLAGHNVVVVVWVNELSPVAYFASNTAYTADADNNQYSLCTVTDAAAGEVTLTLTAEQTSVADEGAIHASVKLRKTSDNTYLEADPVKLGTVVKTIATNIKDF